MPGFLQVLALPVIVKGANVSVEVILGGGRERVRFSVRKGPGQRRGRRRTCDTWLGFVVPGAYCTCWGKG